MDPRGPQGAAVVVDTGNSNRRIHSIEVGMLLLVGDGVVASADARLDSKQNGEVGGYESVPWNSDEGAEGPFLQQRAGKSQLGHIGAPSFGRRIGL